MPLVSPVPFIPFRAFDDDGDPLAGGKLYAFQAGTDTPQDTYFDPHGGVVNAHPVVLDDAGYAHIYLLAGRRYKLRLTDADEVQQWEVDHVAPAGSGGAQNAPSIVLPAVPGGAPLVALGAWLPDWRQIGVLAEVTAAFGTSGGLEQLAIGDVTQFDRWGYCALTLGANTQPRDFRSGESPWTAALSDIVVTPIGGAFDSGGELTLTPYYFTLT